MKRLCLILSLVGIGCSHSPPPLPEEPPYVVTVTKIPLPHTYGQMVEEETDAAPPIKTWLSKEELDAIRLQEAIDEAARRNPCHAGDPLCGYIEGAGE